MSPKTCPICGDACDDARAATCGSQACLYEHRKRLRRRHESRIGKGQTSAAPVIVDRAERVHALGELARWSRVELEAAAAGMHDLAKAADHKASEIVALLGFDPRVHVPDRSVEVRATGDDTLARLISKRTQLLLGAIPGTTAELAAAAGVQAGSVRSYLLGYLERGEVVCIVEKNLARWELA